MKEISVNDKFIIHGKNGIDFSAKVININNYREPGAKYAIEVLDLDGNMYGNDYQFVGDDFFSKNNIERAQ